MRRRNFLRCTSIVILSLLFLSTKMFSFSGWDYYNGEHVYLDSDGRMIINDWRESNGELYFLGEDGYIVRNTLLDYNGTIYFLDENGKRARNQFVGVTDAQNKIPEDLRNGMYYFDDRGHAFLKNGNSFTKVIDGTTYGFDEDGVCLSDGWYDNSGDLIADAGSVLSEGVYHTDGNGCLLRNTWYKFDEDIAAYSIESDYESSVISESYNYMDSLWMYFDNNGKRVHSTEQNTLKEKKINDITYGFDENGIMIEGFTKMHAGLDDTVASNLTLNEKVKYFSTVDGSKRSGEWFWTAPPKELNEEEYHEDIKSWFYIEKGNSTVTYNKLQNINNHKYIFDGIGRMRIGFCFMNAKGQFVASYKPEELRRDDFIFSVTDGGRLYGSDMNDMYFCGVDEFEDGDVLQGKQAITLDDDDEYEFLFRKSGRPYGANNELQLYANSYYINGLKLKAWDGDKYGIVKVSADEYRVVNASGKLVKSRRKVIKDDYDNYMIIINDKLAGYITGNVKAGVGDYIQIKWQSKPKSGGDPGFYYYNKNTEVRDYVGPAVLSGTSCPTASQIQEIPKDMRINFR